jgi:Putative metallopeptidase
MGRMNGKRMRRGAIALFQSLLLAGSCLAGIGSSQPSEAKTAIASQEALAALGIANKQSTNQKQLQQGGKFRVSYERSNDETYEALQDALREVGLFEAIARDFNKLGLILSQDIDIVLGDCQEVNAYYDPTTRSIKICHELINATAQDFYTKLNMTDEEAVENALYVTIFVLYHEVGHALIDVLELPATGREEDAVDEFATILLLNTNSPETAKIVLSAALWFGIPSESQVPAWDEHALNEQRVYNIVCLVYGSNPEQYQFLIEETGMPQQRGDRCIGDYPKKVASWQKLLLPYVAQGNSFL